MSSWNTTGEIINVSCFDLGRGRMCLHGGCGVVFHDLVAQAAVALHGFRSPPMLSIFVYYHLGGN